MSGSVLPERVHIREEKEKTIRDCPLEIGKQLERAAFDKKNANEFIKTRTPHGSDQARPVVTATIEDNDLTISVEDVVGVVELTPTSKLQINPKIGWEDILTMFLSVRDRKRSLEYQGVPIDDFLADDIHIEDIFVVITVNYLSSLQPIYRNGFIRQFSTKRYNAVTGRGRIDVERSIMNRERGIPKQHYIQKNINYNTPVNSLIYCAGKLLLQLFQSTTAKSHNQYFQIFSELREAINRLEKEGVSPDNLNLNTIQGLTIADLPRQRRYYSEALKISKTILSSATGQSLASGTEDLTLDFILDMDHLFERYTQIVLEDEIEKLQDLPLYTGFEQMYVKDEPTLQVYQDVTGTYRPDHVLHIKDEPIAVLDSKYYSRDSDPSQNRDARTSMLAYAYLLETDKMAFLSPFGNPVTRPLAERESTLSVVCPEGDFTIEAYRDSVREYIKQIPEKIQENTEIQEDLNYDIAHSSVNGDQISELVFDDRLRLAERNVSLAREMADTAIELCGEISRKDHTDYFGLVREIRGVLSDNETHTHILPLFIRKTADETIPAEQASSDEEWDDDMFKIYFLTIKQGSVKEISSPKYIELGW